MTVQVKWALNSLSGRIYRAPNELKQLKLGECYLKTTLPTGKIYIKKITVLP